MKRGAENQLRRGDEESEEFEASSESTPGQGFQKASGSVLSTRKIKPLPSRNAASKPMFGENSIANPLDPFATNSSGSVTTTSTFPPATTLSSSKNFFKPFGSDVDAKPTTTPFSFTPSQPATPSSQAFGEPARDPTSTSKAFASILKASTPNTFGNPPSNSQTSPFTTAAPFAPERSTGTSESELTKYYTDIRGLNVSLFNSIKTIIDKDPFSDLGGVLESYKVHRSRLQKVSDELSDTPKADKISSAPPSSSFFGPPSVFKSSVASEPPKSNTVPASSGITFGSSDPAPNIFSSSTKFSSTPSTAFAPTGPHNSSIFGTKSGQTDHSTPSGSSAPAQKPPFSFGTPVANPFGSATTNLFGSSSSTSLSHKLDSDHTFPFGRSSADAATDKKPTPTISFGTPSSVSKNSGIFFGFGSAPSSSDNLTTPVSSVSSEKEMSEGGTEETGTKGGGEDPKETVPGLLTPNPHDEEGTGEENEETVHSVKLKAYRMKKADERDGPGWAELGMGVLRLKKDKSTGARRVLLRNSTNGKININFNIYSGLKPSISKNALTFVGHFEGISQTYCVRLPSESQANELKVALDKEVEFVKAKESST